MIAITSYSIGVGIYPMPAIIVRHTIKETHEYTKTIVGRKPNR